MSVATIELCKELYELSGWDRTDYWWYRVGDQWYSDAHKGTIPAYDLDYLTDKLRNLPQGIVLHNYMDGCEASAMGIEIFADTPADAVCMLAIEVYKRGVWAKEA
jgi:hypothetical protein